MLVGYPVGYLITFTTYGTWPHGDERGSVDKEHNRYGSPFVVSNPHEHRREYSTLKNQPLGLSENQREQVLRAIMEVCRFRGWHAYAVHVRSNHVHVVAYWLIGGKTGENDSGLQGLCDQGIEETCK